MRILYGVVGEGMGHAMRSRVILEHLAKDHEVLVVVSGRAYDYLEKRFRERLRVQRIWGLTIVYEDNAVRNFKTLMRNVGGAFVKGGWPENVRAYFDVVDSFRPDVVVSDFESWSWLYARNHRLPVVSLDNMQIINRCALPPEVLRGHQRDFQVTKAVVKSKVPGAFHYLVTTFFYPLVRKARTTLHPPVLRPEILAARPEPGEHLLVYQTSTSYSDLPALLARTGLECRVYGLRRDLTEEVVEGNLRYRPFSETGFVDDLRTARAVVAGGGFTLMGEAVYLHKPMLSVPVRKQFEQVLNARYLEYERYGLSAEALTEARLRTFLDRLPEFETHLADYRQRGNAELLSMLDQVLARAVREGRAPPIEA